MLVDPLIISTFSDLGVLSQLYSNSKFWPEATCVHNSSRKIGGKNCWLASWRCTVAKAISKGCIHKQGLYVFPCPSRFNTIAILTKEPFSDGIIFLKIVKREWHTHFENLTFMCSNPFLLFPSTTFHFLFSCLVKDLSGLVWQWWQSLRRLRRIQILLALIMNV